jgi:nitrogen regulatory protein P-II 2
VRDALTAVGVHGLTVTEVKGYGRQKGHTEIYRGAEYAVSFLPKIKIEVAVADRPRRQGGRSDHRRRPTGQIGDGKIFVYPIERPCASAPAKPTPTRSEPCRPFQETFHDEHFQDLKRGGAHGAGLAPRWRLRRARRSSRRKPAGRRPPRPRFPTRATPPGC